ncbi:MAG TPA: methylmalonyl Co-A mutase-associated GTPase MeaB [Gemmatimonadales bacterium]
MKPDRSDPAGLARALSVVENGGMAADQLLASLHDRLGGAHRVGITGPPGAGKSTLAHALVRHWREAGRTVAVVAVDPSSPLSGGALLGDRIRMEGVALDQGVFIRSMATRGALGGLAFTTQEVCDVLDAAGFDLILVETVGVGQAELAVVAATDTTVLVLVPESGDGIQTLKSGLMEVADIFAVNKADRPGAELLLREIRLALDLRTVRPGDGAGGESTAWRPPAVLTTASSGAGAPELAQAIAAHWEWLGQEGRLGSRRAARRRSAS